MRERSPHDLPSSSLSENRTMTPIRIQRKRTKGWKMPANTVYVGRPSKWGNDWAMCDAASRGVKEPRQQRAWAVRAFLDDLKGWRKLPWSAFHPDHIKALRGKNLMCWCPLDQPCHADVLLELANQ